MPTTLPPRDWPMVIIRKIEAIVPMVVDLIGCVRKMSETCAIAAFDVPPVGRTFLSVPAQDGQECPSYTGWFTSCRSLRKASFFLGEHALGSSRGLGCLFPLLFADM